MFFTIRGYPRENSMSGAANRSPADCTTERIADGFRDEYGENGLRLRLRARALCGPGWLLRRGRRLLVRSCVCFRFRIRERIRIH